MFFKSIHCHVVILNILKFIWYESYLSHFIVIELKTGFFRSLGAGQKLLLSDCHESVKNPFVFDSQCFVW